MNYIDDLILNIESLCRICLTQSKNMTPLKTNLENSGNCPLILEVLEDVVSSPIICDKGYPELICPMCLGLLKLSYNIKKQYRNSEKILQHHFKNTLNPLPLDDEENCTNKTENVMNEPSPVEIIIGSEKYDLKDILIVEEEKQDQENFNGFLNNLGKTVTAEFVDKSKNSTKTLCEEEPIVMIKKLESGSKDDNMEKGNTNKECIDQYIIIEDDDLSTQNYHENTVNTNSNLNNLNLENLTDVDKELLQSPLGMQLKCNICDKLYSSQVKFNRHLETCRKLQCSVPKKKNKPSVVQCQLCSKIFKQKKILKHHMKKVHGIDPLQYKCDICDQILHNRRVLSYHKLTKHGERKFICEICSKRFFTLNNLKNHILCHTPKNARCVCPVCGKTFHYKGGLFYHMKLHTNERKYCCEYCDKNFYTSTSKKRHTLTHTGVRPYACKYCEKRFCSTGELRKHEFLHTGLRPHNCQYCKKGFSSSYNLKVHLVSHRGPYVCNLCDKTFVTMNVLYFHNKTKHSKDLV